MNKFPGDTRRGNTNCLPAITIAALLAAPLGQATASMHWNEIGDAGDLPGTAQVTSGAGTLDSILGSLLGIDDIDMFAVTVPDLSLFSATTVSPNTEFLDTQLFLFDSSGKGVVANDDDPLGGLEFNARIPVGSVSGPAGTYFVAIAEFDDKPVSTMGKIFPDRFTEPSASADEVVGPTGPGGANPIAGWVVDSYSESLFPPFPDAYEIVFTGAEPAASTVIPEPISLIVWCLLGFTFAATCWGQRRRRQD